MITPVAWLHENYPDAYVITNRVKNIWLGCDPKHVEHYTIPIYSAERRESLLREPIGSGPTKPSGPIINKPRGMA